MGGRWDSDVYAVATAFLRYVRANGYTNWVPGIEAFNAAVNQCRDLPWVRYTRENPKARAAITAVIERLRQSEFTDIERRKDGTTQTARVYFRVKAGRPSFPAVRSILRDPSNRGVDLARLLSDVEAGPPGRQLDHKAPRLVKSSQPSSGTFKLSVFAEHSKDSRVSEAARAAEAVKAQTVGQSSEAPRNPWTNIPSAPPFVLDSDRNIVEAFNRTAGDDVRIQTRLLPEPYVGRPDALVVLLLNNPGLGGGEFELHRKPEFIDRVLSCLRQERADYPNFYLHPRATGDGAEWHRRIFKSLILDFGLQAVANAVLDLEYFPYHSRDFPRGVWLPSQAYTQHLLRTALKRGAAVLVSRGRDMWEAAVPELRNYKHAFYSNSLRNAAVSAGNYPVGYGVIRELVRLC
jgi:hypothetical protein